MTPIGNIAPKGCPSDYACFDAAGMRNLAKWVSSILRWRDQVLIACSGGNEDGNDEDGDVLEN